jgi:hypothetical protein
VKNAFFWLSYRENINQENLFIAIQKIQDTLRITDHSEKTKTNIWLENGVKMRIISKM